MSLIHQALEKIEQEKKGEPLAEPEPLLSEKEKASSDRNTRMLYGIGGAVVLLFVVGVIYLLAHSLRESEPDRGAPVSLPLSSPAARGRFSLTGISRVGEDWTAIINNQLVKAGGSVNGAKVNSITEEKVVLDFRGERISLSLYADASTHFTRLEASG